jgi:hypothetical protein
LRAGQTHPVAVKDLRGTCSRQENNGRTTGGVAKRNHIVAGYGFVGYMPENATVKMPAKKPKGKELAHARKQENRKISTFRILVEHAIGGVKKCRIVKERFRCRKFGFDDLVMLISQPNYPNFLHF